MMHPSLILKRLFACLALMLTVHTVTRAADLVISDELITETFTTTTTVSYDDLIASGKAEYRVNATGGSNVVTVEFDGSYQPSISQPTGLWLLTGTGTGNSLGTLGDRVRIFFNNTPLPSAVTPSGTPPVGWQPSVHPSIVTRGQDHANRLAALLQDSVTGELTVALPDSIDIQDPANDQFTRYRVEGDNIFRTLASDLTVYSVEAEHSILSSNASNVLTIASGLLLLNHTAGNRSSTAIINFGDQTGYIHGDTTRHWAFNAAVQGTNGIVVNDTGRPSAGVPSVISFGSDANTFTGGLTVIGGNVAITGGTEGSGGDGVGLNRDSIYNNLYLGTTGTFDVNGRIQLIGELTGSGTLINDNATATSLGIHVADGDTAEFAGTITNASGALSLEKTGDGTQILSGANSYTGNTTVTGGTLELADSGSLRFVIADDGENNQIAGTGDLLLNGSLVFDLGGAGTIVGNAWEIVDISSLSTTFGGSFSVSSLEGAFSESGGLWTRFENSVEYQFDQSTGVLSVIPEPASAILLGLAAALFVVVRRRAK